jgi:hypothetical protein
MYHGRLLSCRVRRDSRLSRCQHASRTHTRPSAANHNRRSYWIYSFYQSSDLGSFSVPKKKVKVKQLIQSGNGQMLETITSTGRLMGESLVSENRQSIAAYNRDSIAAYRDSVASFNGDMVPRASAEYRSYHWGHNTAHIFHTQEHEEIIKE